MLQTLKNSIESEDFTNFTTNQKKYNFTISNNPILKYEDGIGINKHQYNNKFTLEYYEIKYKEPNLKTKVFN